MGYLQKFLSWDYLLQKAEEWGLLGDDTGDNAWFVVFFILLLAISLPHLWKSKLEPFLLRRSAKSKRLAHREQAAARVQLPYYSEAISNHPKILGISVEEFAKNAQISEWDAKALMQNPDVKPRPDLWEPIEKALLLPSGYLYRGTARDGSMYGSECSIARLDWLREKGLGSIYTDEQYRKLVRNSYARGHLLSRIERQRKTELGLD